jgi:hypothetical protein
MIRRIFWLAVGVTVGSLVTLYTLAGIRRARTGLDPHTAPQRVAQRATHARSRVRDALEEGRRARHQYEARAAHRQRRSFAG